MMFQFSERHICLHLVIYTNCIFPSILALQMTVLMIKAVCDTYIVYQ